MNRREFIKNSGGAILGSTFLGALSCFGGGRESVEEGLSEVEEPHFFLLIRVFGGMDSTVGLNPWLGARPNNSDLFLDSSYECTPPIDGCEFRLGPSAVDLKRHARDLSLIHGIFMGTKDLGHPFAINYMTTAKQGPDAPFFIAEMAEDFRLRKAHAFETVLFNGEARSSKLNRLLWRPTQLLLKKPMQPGRGVIEPIRAEGSPLRFVRQALEKNFHKQGKFTSVLGQLEKITSVLGAEHAVVASFASGLGRFAQIDWNEFGELDSHHEFVNIHQVNQKKVWNRVASLLDCLKGTSYLNTNTPLFPNLTTVMVISEFSRSPDLNENRGKEHNYFDNSVLIGGRGVRGGIKLGAHHLFPRNSERTQPQLSGCHIDYKTGLVAKKNGFSVMNNSQSFERGDFGLIRPENVLRTVASIFRSDLKNFSLLDSDARPLPRLVL